MPHEPGHTNQNVNYVIRGTNEPYSGLVVMIGDTPFTTEGGALEGFSYELVGDNVEQQESIDASSGVNDSLNNIVNVNPLDQDIVTTFLVGDSSEFGQGTYYEDKPPYARIPKDTPLHHHTRPAVGNTNFMTQHSMSGTGRDAARNVLTKIPQQQALGNVQNVTTMGRNTGVTTPTRRRSSGGGGMSGGGGGGY